MATPGETCIMCLEGWWAPGGPLLRNNFCACNFAYHPACMREWRTRVPFQECIVCRERVCSECGERYLQSPAEGLCMRCAARIRREAVEPGAHLDDVIALWRREPAVVRLARVTWRGSANALATLAHAALAPWAPMLGLDRGRLA